MRLEDIILEAREKKASDIHISEGLPLFFRINGKLMDSQIMLSPKDTHDIIMEVVPDVFRDEVKSGLDADFAMEIPDGRRQRVNVFHQKRKLAATIRLLNDHIPSLEELNLPKVLKELADEPRGLVLVTGPTGSGKSTTLAAMVDYINHRHSRHIVTIEDPIEYVFHGDQSLIHQREVGVDTPDFASALRSVLREDPDVILVGEMRDYETIQAAVTAAETGHLVLATLHTTGAAQTIDRIIDACPGDTQNQIRTQMSTILAGVVSQCLVPTKSGSGRVAATEILTGTDAALNLVRENKCFQMNSILQSGGAYGMHTLNGNLAKLVHEGIITPQAAFEFSNDKRDLEQYI